MMYKLLWIILSTAMVGGTVYGGCVFWPLNLPEPTGLIAAVGCAMAWMIILAVYLDSRAGDTSGPPR
jgi:hypothetical protein